MELLAGNIEHYAKIRDPIYGFIELPEKFKSIVDHKLFQRLRRISQLPLENMVYPSANHSRFEHSLGVMYLSMFAAIRITEFLSKHKGAKRFFDNNEYLKHIEKYEEKKQQFFYAAGLVGLLHDVGHGPFSHTIERVLNYNHEKYGYIVAKKIIDDLKLNTWQITNIVLNVLNKEKKYDELDNVEKVLRDIIDNNLIDVDKGDYLLRDSYHCGVNYGLYDYMRVWNYIKLHKDKENNNFFIVFDEKVASEIWRLQFAKFLMYDNVYKHHLRQITDVMLIEAIKFYKKQKNLNLENLIPIKENDIIWDKFLFWTDDNFLDVLSQSNSDFINKFLTRDLYKRFFNVKWDEANIEAIDNLKQNIIKEFNVNEIDFILYIFNKLQPPIKNEYIQTKKIVLTRSGEIKSIAEYFNFVLDKKENLTKKYLQVFVSKNSEIFKEKSKDIQTYIEREIEPNLFNINYD